MNDTSYNPPYNELLNKWVGNAFLGKWQHNFQLPTLILSATIHFVTIILCAVKSTKIQSNPINLKIIFTALSDLSIRYLNETYESVFSCDTWQLVWGCGDWFCRSHRHQTVWTLLSFLPSDHDSASFLSLSSSSSSSSLVGLQFYLIKQFLHWKHIAALNVTKCSLTCMMYLSQNVSYHSHTIVRSK